MKIGGMCLNWKVVAGLAAVGVGVLLLVPGAAGAALPLLLLAACPLSMLVMMRAMQHPAAAPAAAQGPAPASPAVTAGPGTRDAQLAALRDRLQHLEREREALAGQVDALSQEAPRPEGKPAPLVPAAAKVG